MIRPSLASGGVCGLASPLLRTGVVPRKPAGFRGSISAVTGTLGSEARAPTERALSVHELTLRLRHEERVSQALREVGIALGTTFDLDDLLELILGKLTELVEADRATLYLLDEANDELVSRMVVGEQVRSIRMKVGHGIAGLVAQTGAALRVRDAYSDPRFERVMNKTLLRGPFPSFLACANAFAIARTDTVPEPSSSAPLLIKSPVPLFSLPT